jgi:hypothetical protein
MEASGFVEAGVQSAPAELADGRRGPDWPLVALFLIGVPVLYAAMGVGLYELFAFVS